MIRKLFALCLALGTSAMALAACEPARPPCKHFDVGQKVRVTAFPTEQFVVVGFGLACTVYVWKPGVEDGISFPADTLEPSPN